MAVNIYRNPFILGLWAPLYQLLATVAITNDFLMGAMFIMATLALLGAYVTEFPVLKGLYPNELLHKLALSSLLGFIFGLVLWAISMIFTGGVNPEESTQVISPAGKFMATWVALGVPAYFLMVFLVSRLNKRNLEEEHRIREEKKKKKKGGGPPIMTRDGF